MRYLDKLEEAKVDRGLTRAQKMVAREMRKDDTPDPLAKKNRTKADRKRAIEKLKRDRENPGVAKAATLAKNRERATSLRMQRLANKITGDGDPNEKPKPKPKREVAHTTYQQIGDIIAEVAELALQDIHDTTKRALKAARHENPRVNRRKRKGRNQGRRATDQDLAESKAGDRYKKQQDMKTIISNINAKSAQADAAMPKPDPTPGVKDQLVSRLVRAARSVRKKITGSGLTRREAQVADRLRSRANADYRSAENAEAGGAPEETVKERSARAHKRMSKAHDIEGRGK
jgi:hypothetical protein